MEFGGVYNNVSMKNTMHKNTPFTTIKLHLILKNINLPKAG